MAAHLTTTVSGREYDSIEDLRRDGIPVYIPDSLFLRRSFQKCFPDVYRDIVAHSWFMRHIDDAPDLLAGGNAVYGIVFDLKILMARNCSLGLDIFHYVGSLPSGFAMRKNHPMLGQISRQIVKYLADGSIEDIVDKYAGSGNCSLAIVQQHQQHQPSAPAPPRGDLAKMKGLLVVAAALGGLGVAVAGVEALVAARRKKMQEEEETKRKKKKMKKRHSKEAW